MHTYVRIIIITSCISMDTMYVAYVMKLNGFVQINNTGPLPL